MYKSWLSLSQIFIRSAEGTMERVTLLAVAVIVCATCSALNTWEIPRDNLLDHVTRDLDRDWLKFKKAFNKTYESPNEELRRRLFWEDTVRYIRTHNVGYQAGRNSFPLAENQFADMADDEFRKTHLSGVAETRPTRGETRSPKVSTSGSCLPGDTLRTLPPSIDWREKGYVTSVKNQGDCNACTAFAAVAVLEGLNRNMTGKLQELSEQNLVDCVDPNFTCSSYPDQGIKRAFEYVQEKGIDLAACYVLTSPFKVSKCAFKKDCSVLGAANWNFSYVDQNDECSLRLAVATYGPVAAQIDASHESFRSYNANSTDDVYYEKDCHPNGNLTHAVTIVGYGTSKIAGEYWIVKNSWGTKWGDHGYAYMARDRDNNCQIANDAFYLFRKQGK